MYRIPMLYGRFINDADLRSLRKVMVIGTDDAKTLFGDAEKLSDSGSTHSACHGL